MNIKRLLGKGFFPKELPPPFETTKLADKSQYINTKWQTFLNNEKRPKTGESNQDAKKRYNDLINKYSNSKCAEFSLAKGTFSRRKLNIPNPKQYHDLCKLVVDKWTEIRKTYHLTDFSASTPIESNAKRAVRTKSKSLNNFQFELIEKSFNKQFELRLDISQFYPTIYTHSITWAIMGKVDAKKYFNLRNNRNNWATLLTTDPKAKLYEFCNSLDTLVRNCQEKQSVGLPIGPDVSFILAEVIGNRIDSEIKKQLSDIDFEGTRYYDDYYFYVDSYNDAEKILKVAQGVLNEFRLETNESKVKIKKLPFSFEARWISSLSNHRFNSVNKYELRNFFSIIFTLTEEYPFDTSWIISYGLGRFEYGNIKVPKEDWDFFLNLLIKTLLIDSSNIDQFFKIILSYELYLNKVSKEKINKILHRLIKDHLSLNHSFEVSWGLWILKSLKIKCDHKILKEVFKSEDNISKLICHDIIKSKLFTGKLPSLNFLNSELHFSDLWSDKWLYTYESLIQGWLVPTTNVIEQNEYFKTLYDYGVKFYNNNNQIIPEFIEKVKPNKTVVPIISAETDLADFFSSSGIDSKTTKTASNYLNKDKY